MRSQLWAWSHPRVQKAQRQGWGRYAAPSNYSVIKWAFLCSDQHGHELWNSDCLILCGLKKHSPIFPKHSLSFLCEVSCLGSWWEEGVGVGLVEWLFQMLQLFQDWKQNWNDPDGWPNEAEPKSMPRGARAVFHLSVCMCMCVCVCERERERGRGEPVCTHGWFLAEKGLRVVGAKVQQAEMDALKQRKEITTKPRASSRPGLASCRPTPSQLHPYGKSTFLWLLK